MMNIEIGSIVRFRQGAHEDTGIVHQMSDRWLVVEVRQSVYELVRPSEVVEVR